MVRILYGVCGEGMGHAVRSAVIIKHLLKNHEVMIVTNDRAFDYLSEKFDNVHYIAGYNIVYENNIVNNIKTFIKAVKPLPKDLTKNLRLLRLIVKKFKPSIIITDFEPFVNIIAHIMRIPIISIGNHHIITKTKMKIPSRYLFDRLRAISVIRLFVVRPKKYLITTFFYPPVKNEQRILLFPPILREEIQQLKPSKGKHVLVYQTSKSYQKLIPVLKNIAGEKFIVYGLDQEKREGNVQFREFNEDLFLQEFASAKAVIINGGFTFMSEALHLNKPVLSVPISKQFEQIVNAIHLQKLNYGEFHEDLDEKIVSNFLANLKTYERHLKAYPKEDNSKILKKIDELLE